MKAIYKLVSRHLTTASKEDAYSTYQKLAVQWLNKHLCLVLSSMLADSFMLRNRQLLKPKMLSASIDGFSRMTNKY